MAAALGHLKDPVPLTPLLGVPFDPLILSTSHRNSSVVPWGRVGAALAVAILGVFLGSLAAELRDIERRLAVLMHRTDRAMTASVRLASARAPLPPTRSGVLLATWHSVAGCGAGSSTGIGGIKWIGRNVSGGLVNVQSQVSYTRFSDGYVYSVQNQISADLGDRWNVGVVVPYLYKYHTDPFGLRFDLSNKGLGDVNLLLSRRFGPIAATTVTLSLGLPTGSHQASHLGNYLRQDRQLGVGEPSGGLLVDHVLDNLWGPVVIGGVVSYPGRANQLENFRAPSGTVYSYAGYLLGPVVPAIGVSATAFWGADRDRGLASDDRPPWMLSANASLEWSTDWVALLVGASLPYHVSGLQPWTAGVGLALSPF